VVMVVEQPRDVLALESTGAYRGLYHVLLGRLSPLDGIGPSDLTIPQLWERLDDAGRNAGGVAVEELILGLNPTMEGDGTSLYLSEQCRRRKVRLTRLARGVCEQGGAGRCDRRAPRDDGRLGGGGLIVPTRAA
jgi:recombination protein RecR